MAGRADIIEQIVEKAPSLTKRQAGDVFDATVEAVAGYLAAGERVQVPSLGSFTVTARAARTGRNPATGEPIQIAAARVAKFKPSTDLKKRLNS